MIAVMDIGFVALLMWETARMESDGPRRSDGGQPDPAPGPDRPSDPQLVDGTDDDLAPVFGVISLQEREPRAEKAEKALILVE